VNEFVKKVHYYPKFFLIPYGKYKIIAIKCGDKKEGGVLFQTLKIKNKKH